MCKHASLIEISATRAPAFFRREVVKYPHVCAWARSDERGHNHNASAPDVTSCRFLCVDFHIYGCAVRSSYKWKAFQQHGKTFSSLLGQDSNRASSPGRKTTETQVSAQSWRRASCRLAECRVCRAGMGHVTTCSYGSGAGSLLVTHYSYMLALTLGSSWLNQA